MRKRSKGSLKIAADIVNAWRITLGTDLELRDAIANAIMDEREAHFKLLLEIIRSDQLTHEQCVELLQNNPEFARWYEEQMKEQRFPSPPPHGREG